MGSCFCMSFHCCHVQAPWLTFFNTVISLKFLLAQTLISFVAQHLCVRTNLIYDPLKQNKQSFSVHILVVIAWVRLLNGQIYSMFCETRQLGRKWHSWLYMEKKPFLFLLKFLQSKDLNQTSCLFVYEDTSLMLAGQSWLPLWSSVMKQHCFFLNVRYIIWLHNVGRRVGPKEYAHIIQINVFTQMWLVRQISKHLLLVQENVSVLQDFLSQNHPESLASRRAISSFWGWQIIRNSDVKPSCLVVGLFFFFSKED